MLNHTGDDTLHIFFFFSSRRRHTRLQGDWSSDVCSSDLRKTLFYRRSPKLYKLFRPAKCLHTTFLSNRTQSLAPKDPLTGILSPVFHSNPAGSLLPAIHPLRTASLLNPVSSPTSTKRPHRPTA